VLRVACVDFGSAVGCTGRARFCQDFLGRVESLDYAEGWEQSWPLLRGGNLEGRGGWGWHKFSDELRKAIEFLV